jgi:hypothetical protein
VVVVVEIVFVVVSVVVAIVVDDVLSVVVDVLHVLVPNCSNRCGWRTELIAMRSLEL